MDIDAPNGGASGGNRAADAPARPTAPPSPTTGSTLGGGSTVPETLVRLAATVPITANIRVPADQACLRKPDSLVREYLLIDGEQVGHVDAFHKAMNPILYDSMHTVRFAGDEANPSQILLRRRKMGRWNSGRSFAILDRNTSSSGTGASGGGGGVAEDSGSGGGGGGSKLFYDVLFGILHYK